mmetsp:Transcript_2060/g.6100  ORF Transcript_2060/g.6100 Transcript_2060/m.6100 type:complete len:311 (+) Transcript_2060:289-1221(+)|eukprot:CAMPEP_0117682772 /NCGR_PEP_ID=MMETSP0804-20121206/19905_1 /TAXON_ID=1074897 /ORGANISM="Tetraselmis astigmatica, Strain CCMP880" /LENGTH=310 /DNA_ID=CAMNT_0005493041 /DNA_START=222 /DNA_END=1154 /DNA_ORIENTATION=-
MVGAPAGGSLPRGGLCVVTGGNNGIGKEVAGGLMKEGAHVVLGCRSLARCREAKAELDSRGLPGTCECQMLDLCSVSSVRGFTSTVAKASSATGLRVLINNAGVMGLPGDPEPLKDGHLLPNHLGPFLLTNQLLHCMRPGSRVVNVASRAHFQGSLEIGDSGQGGGRGPSIIGTPSSWYHSYARSKLCNVLHMAELQRRMDDGGHGVMAFSVSPGLVNTGIFRNVWAPLRWALSPLIHAVYQTPEQGARTVLHAACSPELKQGGLYLHNLKAATPAALAQEPALARGLWAASERLIEVAEEQERQKCGQQ